MAKILTFLQMEKIRVNGEWRRATRAGRYFTQETPPRSKHSQSFELWHWWKELTGDYPDALHGMRPGYWQRFAGAANYMITYNGRDYLIRDVKRAVTQTWADTYFDGIDWWFGE
jgi:hypothetical protein